MSAGFGTKVVVAGVFEHPALPPAPPVPVPVPPVPEDVTVTEDVVEELFVCVEPVVDDVVGLPPPPQAATRAAGTSVMARMRRRFMADHDTTPGHGVQRPVA
jgi:hypothetical protein